MASSYLRVSKELKLLKDGSTIFNANNGCRSNYPLHIKDIVNHPVWSPQKNVKIEKSIHPHLDKYKKKFAKKIK